MNSNQFRRDPISGRWTIIVQDKVQMKEFNLNQLTRKTKKRNEGHKDCRFCQGHERQTASEIFAIRNNSSAKDDSGWSVRVIPEQAHMLQIYGELNNRGVGMYDVLDGIGAHEIVIESPDHDVHISNMEEKQIEDVLRVYRERILDLKRDVRFRYVLLHKNYGDGSRETVDHSYSHIIATPITPTLVKAELVNAMEYYQYKERCVFCDMINQEITDDERIISQNDHFLAFSPFAARSPFEVWILPKKHETFFEWNTHQEPLAVILKEILNKITVTLNDPNFIMVLHSGPNIAAGKLRGYWRTLEKDYHWHMEITPRFRGVTSFEVGSGFQINQVPPEVAAKILREQEMS